MLVVIIATTALARGEAATVTAGKAADEEWRVSTGRIPVPTPVYAYRSCGSQQRLLVVKVLSELLSNCV